MNKLVSQKTEEQVIGSVWVDQQLDVNLSAVDFQLVVIINDMAVWSTFVMKQHINQLSAVSEALKGGMTERYLSFYGT